MSFLKFFMPVHVLLEDQQQAVGDTIPKRIRSLGCGYSGQGNITVTLSLTNPLALQSQARGFSPKA